MNAYRVLRAAEFAARKHAGQVRKSAAGNGAPYVTHPLRVATMLAQGGADEVTVVAAILHDTLEDTDATVEELIREFGGDVASIVVEVTDDKTLPKDKRKESQVRRASSWSQHAKLVKVGDKTDNLLSIIESPPAWSTETKLAYAASAERVVRATRIHEHYSDLSGQLVRAFNDALRKLRESLA